VAASRYLFAPNRHLLDSVAPNTIVLMVVAMRSWQSECPGPCELPPGSLPWPGQSRGGGDVATSVSSFMDALGSSGAAVQCMTRVDQEGSYSPGFAASVVFAASCRHLHRGSGSECAWRHARQHQGRASAAAARPSTKHRRVLNSGCSGRQTPAADGTPRMSPAAFQKSVRPGDLYHARF
jgi:hypothetical protein